MMTEFGKGSGSSIWGKENFCYSHQIIKAAASVVKWIKCLKYDATVIRYIHILWYKLNEDIVWWNNLLSKTISQHCCYIIIWFVWVHKTYNIPRSFTNTIQNGILVHVSCNTTDFCSHFLHFPSLLALSHNAQRQ